MSRKIMIVTLVFVSLIFASPFLIIGSVQAQAASDDAMGASKATSGNSGYKMTVSYQIIGGGTSSFAPTLKYTGIKRANQNILLDINPQHHYYG